ncbi:N-methyl-L-tryptophan oxidase [Deinococcus arenicola]|uniref:N-methyl-L-tryptophan oxidase n=1 Tax=Deinococcus arenicola TaxID=2994950 RepID=A0ABU4DP76_9DEIO|nr:N-methyl-L-tryptophan oxidase [Deinococcus sp. ZS9-10]MDV6374244.1 N-methyl-L-tryptophan oxidase [Deinococcus sp. ZS9-10]
MKQHVQHLIIGAGAAGSAAAYALARRGQEVLLLEQFGIGHERGSSFGPSRIFRLAYEEPEYAGLALAALESWRTLENESGQPLYWRTGGLDLGPAGTPGLEGVHASLSALNAAPERLSRRELARRFPQWQVPSDWEAVYSPEAGIVSPQITLRVLTGLARRHGAQILENVAALEIEPGTRPAVRTSTGVITCDHLIVAAGAWLPRLVPGLQAPLSVTLAASSFYRPDDLAAFQPERFPVFITHDDEFQAYGFPAFGVPGVKLGVDVVRPVTSGDTRSFEVPPQVVEASDTFMRRYLPGASTVMERQTCLITRAPGGDFILAPHPDCPQITLASPCSGHGFKFTPLLGELLAAHALGERHPWQLPRFGLPPQDRRQTAEQRPLPGGL